MNTLRMPQMTEAAYTKIREAFRRSIPTKVTTTWLMTNVEGYRVEASARTLLANLKMFGLVADDGGTTELAMQWRNDDTYGASCEVLLRNAFPLDLVDAVAGGTPPTEVLENLFMNHGVGIGSAKNLSRIFRLIASKEIPAGRLSPSNGSGKQSKSGGGRKSQTTASSNTPDTEVSVPRPPNQTPGPNYTVLRYFLDRGRLAEVSVPPDLDEREKRRLFAHLKIDLLDQVEV